MPGETNAICICIDGAGPIPVARRADSRGVKSFLVHVKSLSASLSVLGLPPGHLAPAADMAYQASG